MSRIPVTALFCFLLIGGGFLHAMDQRDQWALEADLGGAAALASQTIKDEGKTGLSYGIMVRFNRNDTWDTGFGYNVLSLKNNVRFRPATFVVDRRLNPWGTWAPFLRIGAGLAADQSSGALNRLTARGGVGVRRPLNNQWDVGIKSEAWYSPHSADTGHDMLFVTAGFTLSRSFARTTPKAKAKKPEPLKPAAVVEPVTEEKGEAPAVGEEELPKPDQILTEPPKPLHILFQTEGWKIDKSNAEAKAKAMQAMAQFLLAYPTVPAEIHGHADSKGPLGYNIALSRRRAESLRDLFVNRWGLKSERFAIFAHGSKKPVATNGTPLGRAKNRRAVVIVLSEWLP
jgi:outer membrane protein OmpA-like peptidoglycan-associated protein